MNNILSFLIIKQKIYKINFFKTFIVKNISVCYKPLCKNYAWEKTLPCVETINAAFK